MRTEVPVCTRCCFCIPLRYGVLGWAYLKLIANLLVLTMLCHEFYLCIKNYFVYGLTFYKGPAIAAGIFSLLIACQISFIVVLLVGGHKKNIKLLRIYYMFSLVVWILTVVAGFILLCLALSTMRPTLIRFELWLLMMNGAGVVASIMLEGYFLLLVRSEIVKLTNNCEFRFENHAVNAQCVLNILPETLNNEESKNVNINHEDLEKETEYCKE